MLGAFNTSTTAQRAYLREKEESSSNEAHARSLVLDPRTVQLKDDAVAKDDAVEHYRKNLDQKRQQDDGWVHDEVWFNEQAKKGCCPFAAMLYDTRYAKVEYRCCTTKIAEGKIDPLRAVVGVDYSRLHKNTTILIQGDSLAEQHFLGMMCFAWSAHNLTVHLRPLSKKKDSSEGVIWSSNILLHSIGRNAVITIQFLRWNRPQIANEEIYDVLEDPHFIVLGGWHHGGTDSSQIERFLNQAQSRWGSKVIVVDALPSHFPGGVYRGDGDYPNTVEMCKETSSHGHPNINQVLNMSTRNKTNITLLNASRLYYNRGNAHIGYISRGVVGPQGRDCLHWCIAPGVMDALTRMTLAAVYAMS